MQNNKSKRFFSIRMTQPEFDKLHRRYKAAGFESLTQYAKNKLLGKHMNLGTRELLQYLLLIKNSHENIERFLHEKNNEEISREVIKMKTATQQFYERHLTIS